MKILKSYTVWSVISSLIGFILTIASVILNSIRHSKQSERDIEQTELDKEYALLDQQIEENKLSDEEITEYTNRKRERARMGKIFTKNMNNELANINLLNSLGVMGLFVGFLLSQINLIQTSKKIS